MLFNLSLCESCAFYVPKHQTCKTSVVALSKDKVYFNFAASVRADQAKCGPSAVLFVPKAPEPLLSAPDISPADAAER